MRDENEIRLKRAYWSGFYYGLDPEKRLRSKKTEKEWLTAEVWLTALDWVLGQEKESAARIREVEDTQDWSME